MNWLSLFEEVRDNDDDAVRDEVMAMAMANERKRKTRKDEHDEDDDGSRPS